jgi:hypothetical protein
MAEPRNPIQVIQDYIERSSAPDHSKEHEAEFRRVANGVKEPVPPPARPQPVDPMRLVPDDDEFDDDDLEGDGPEPDEGASEPAALMIAGAPVPVPAGLQVGPDEARQFTEFASRTGLSRAQAEALLAYEAQRQASAARTTGSQEAAWRRESLATFQPNEIEQAQSVLRQHGGREIEAFLNESGFGSHPAVIRLLTNIARDRAGR